MAGDRGTRHGRAAHAGETHRQRLHHDRRVRRRRGRDGPFRADLRCVAQAAAQADRSRRVAARHRSILEGMGVARHGRRRVARRRASIADGAQGPHLRADRRHRRGGDDVAAGTDRRAAQLGLPLLLAARRDADAARADERRLCGRGARVARLAAARGGRLARSIADHVRPSGRAAAARMGDLLAARLRAVEAGARRQRCSSTSSAR